MKKLNSFLEITKEDLEKLTDVIFNSRLLKIVSQTEDRIVCEISWDLTSEKGANPVDDTVVFTRFGVGTTLGEADKINEDELFEKFLVARGLSKYQEDNPFMED